MKLSEQDIKISLWQKWLKISNLQCLAISEPKSLTMITDYSIKDIISYRKLVWSNQNDFFYLTHIPNSFEAFSYQPDFYLFGILDEGSITIEINYTTYTVKPGYLLVYKPEQIIKVHHISNNTKGAFFMFTKGFIEKGHFQKTRLSFFDVELSNPCFKLTAKDYDSLQKIYNPIIQLLGNLSSKVWNDSANNLLVTLLLESNALIKNYTNYSFELITADVQIYNKFKTLVLKHFKQYRKLNFYSSSLNISVNYLYKVVKRQSGSSPTEILNKKLVSAAQNLLQYSSQTISEIAFEFHFASLQSFSKFFKQHTNYSPSSYRIYARSL